MNPSSDESEAYATAIIRVAVRQILLESLDGSTPRLPYAKANCSTALRSAVLRMVLEYLDGSKGVWVTDFIFVDGPGPVVGPSTMDPAIEQLDREVFDNDDCSGVWAGSFDPTEEVEVYVVDPENVAVRRPRWYRGGP